MGTRSGGRGGERLCGPGKMLGTASQDGTSGAATPVTVTGVSTTWAAGARTVFIPQRRCSERCRHLPNVTKLVTGRLEFQPRAVGLQSPRS